MNSGSIGGGVFVPKLTVGSSIGQTTGQTNTGVEMVDVHLMNLLSYYVEQGLAKVAQHALPSVQNI